MGSRDLRFKSTREESPVYSFHSFPIQSGTIPIGERDWSVRGPRGLQEADELSLGREMHGLALSGSIHDAKLVFLGHVNIIRENQGSATRTITRSDLLRFTYVLRTID